MKLSSRDSSPFTGDDRRWMLQALEIAGNGLGYVAPNPMVGCVLVADGQVLGIGFHAKFGGPHAERAAIANAVDQGNGAELQRATAYVTLEPCCHHGKTPPCTQGLIDAGIARVVVAMLDPFEKIQGRGVEQLRLAGIDVQIGLEEEAAEFLNAPYLKRVRTGLPWVIAKWAMSLDGKIATHTGHSQWISSEASRAEVHRLRAKVDAILVGSGTALADDPLLTARTHNKPARRALRVIADSRLRIPLTSQLVKTAGEYPTLIWAGASADCTTVAALRSAGCIVEMCPPADPQERLNQLLKYLASEKHVTNLLVEGGGELLGSLLEMRQIDQCEVFLAPKLIGGQGALSPLAGLGLSQVDDGPSYQHMKFEQTGDDVHISCRFQWC